MSSLAEIQRSFARACLATEPDDADLDRLRGDRDRWLLYREMVRSRLVHTARLGLAGTAAALGERWDRDLTSYLADPGPRSRYLREIVHELVEHALASWASDPSLPPHVVDLARYEDARWRVGGMRWVEQEASEFDFERRAVINPTARTLVVSYRVDRDAVAPPRLDEPEHLIVYRKPHDPRAHTWGLNEIGGRLFEAWCKEHSCADGVRDVLAALGRQPDSAFIDGMAGVLADLIEQKVVLGSP